MKRIEIAIAGFEPKQIQEIEEYVKKVLCALIPGFQTPIAFIFVATFFELDSTDCDFIVANREEYKFATLPVNGLDVFLISDNDFQSDTIPPSLLKLSSQIREIFKGQKPQTEIDSPTSSPEPALISEKRNLILNALKNKKRKPDVKINTVEDYIRKLIKELGQINYSSYILCFSLTDTTTGVVYEKRVIIPESNDTTDVAIPATDTNETATITRLELFIYQTVQWLMQNPSNSSFDLTLEAPSS